MNDYLYYSKTSFPLIKGKMFSNAPNKLFSISNQIISCGHVQSRFEATNNYSIISGISPTKL